LHCNISLLFPLILLFFSSFHLFIMSTSADAKTTKTFRRMQPVPLGGSCALKVSPLALGTMTFSTGNENGVNNWGLPVTDQKTSHALLDAFVKAGGNLIDTANCYGNGDSEAAIGNWLKAKSEDDSDFRSKIVIATKFSIPIGYETNAGGWSRTHILQAVKDSLKRLQTDYIDLYQAHRWESAEHLETMLSTMNTLIQNGTIRYYGLSNFTGWQLAKAIGICERKGWEKPISLQPEYSLLCRETEWELIECCKSEKLAVLPWSPLAGGWLSGRYRRGMEAPEDGSRVAWAEMAGWDETGFSARGSGKTWDIIDEIIKISEELEATPAQVSLRWLMQRPGVTSVLVGAKKMQHLTDNLQASQIELSDDQMQRLNKVSGASKLPYPYSLQNN
jgi:aryl-alcohol dehydrogenase-like predicted oxidoreductase